jgi:hypothetical protein
METRKIRTVQKAPVAVIREYHHSNGGMGGEQGIVQVGEDSIKFSKFRASTSGTTLNDALCEAYKRGARILRNESGYQWFVNDLGREEGLTLV